MTTIAAIDALDANINWPAFSYDPEIGELTKNGMGGTMVYAAWDASDDKLGPKRPKIEFDGSKHILAGVEGPLAEQFQAGGTIIVSDLVLIAGSEMGLAEFGAGEEDDKLLVITRELLSDSGLALLTALEAIHGGPATLVTYNSDDRWTIRWN